MATLAVLKFDTPEGAGQTLQLIESLGKQELVTLQDAAIVTWPQGKKKPKTQQLHSLGGLGALNGAFWGFLFGLIFFIPILGMAIGAAMGALSGKFSDIGISDDFIKEIQSQVTEGTSALFLLIAQSTPDKFLEGLKAAPKFEIISTNLTAEQEAAVKQAFAEEEVEA
jgi:uncharacterized membrane protein